MKIVYIYNIIEKVVSVVFYTYIFDFITYFCNTFINIKPFVINIFTFPDILSNNSKY